MTSTVVAEPDDPRPDWEGADRVLLDAGLVRQEEGALFVRGDVFGQALASGPPPRLGVERLLDGRGQIDRYPSDDDEYRALLEFAAEQSLEPGEVVPEAELNERLLRFSSDTAGLRRRMVDHQVLERTRSGSEYARVCDP